MRNYTKYQFISALDHKMELSRPLMARDNYVLYMAVNPDWGVLPSIAISFLVNRKT